MGDLLGGIQRGLGFALDAIYDLTSSYAIAIILLTVAVRAMLIPLTVKQMRSMAAMQALGPETKKIQQKYKGMQAKAADRAEVQQIRLSMNAELQGLYKAHGVNPLGGCFPLLAQMPVFIAMFSIMRASIVAVPLVATLAVGGTIPAGTLPTEGREAKAVLCRPVDASGEFLAPKAEGPSPTNIKCEGPNEKDYGTFRVSKFQEGKGGQGPDLASAPWISSCTLTGSAETPFSCLSATGSGHLPRTGSLFDAVTRDKAGLLGMRAGCSASQVRSVEGLRACTTGNEKPGGATAIPYYLLIGLIVATSYYQSKQMGSRATGAQAQQMAMMTKIMPVMFGFISLSIPAGANLYFLATNVWTIGQQHILLKRQDEAKAAAANGSPPSNGKASKSAPVQTVIAEEAPKRPPQRPSNKKKRKKKR